MITTALVVLGFLALAYVLVEHAWRLVYSYRTTSSRLEVRLFHLLTVHGIRYDNIAKVRILSPWRAIGYGVVPFSGWFLTRRLFTRYLRIDKKRGLTVFITPQDPEALRVLLEEEARRCQRSPQSAGCEDG